MYTENIISTSKSKEILDKYKQIEQESAMTCKKISGSTYVCCKNPERISLYEKAHKGVKIVYGNEL